MNDYDVALARKTVGGTDISKLIGNNPYEDAVSLLKRKRKGLDVELNLKMLLGQVLEDAVANVYAQTKGVILHGDGVQSITHGTRRATVDRYIIEGNTIRVVDIKTRWSFWWEKILPPYYADQVLYYTGILEDTQAYGNYIVHDPMVVTMFAGELYEVTVPYDREYYEQMGIVADEFATYLSNTNELKTSQIILWQKRVEDFTNKYKGLQCTIMNGLVVETSTT